ncbi:hypothetical protein [Halococcus thailandensis]|uniref:Transposase (ISH8/ISH26) n=1 Tax=Halococcus thailandensis JCM 13552 TaxID=1227457 RepID=M0NFG1_9EURY|nr:hypothetical protein [Halococcus thailandensis]EMA56712.1 transposase (ISH8/ISH26) [Halococcus thailandensis JCM 13552]
METSPDRVVDGFTELLDEVDSEEIANEHRVGIHSNRIDFEEYAKIGAFLGIHDPKTLNDLDQQTDVRDDLEPISQSHFSRLTNRRPWGHFALFGFDPADKEFIEETIQELLDESV